MTTLNIGGKRVTVSDDFLKLSPEQQNATVEEIAGKMAPKVDPATNQPPGVPAFVPPGVEGYDPKTGEVQKYGMLGSAGMGAADMAGMGFADEGAAGLVSLLEKLPGRTGKSYSQALKEIRGNQQQAYDDNKKSYIAGMAGAGVAGGTALVKSGLSLGARAAQSGAGLLRTALGSAVDGGFQGLVHGVGSGDGLEDRAKQGALGLAAGATVGGAVPYATTVLGALLKPMVAPIMARLKPDTYANAAMGEGLRRSGATPQSIVQALNDARADNQPVYSVADALGLTGQRLASTVSRVPHEGRQAFVESLNARQAGQGRRITNALSEAFDAPDTAAQRTAALTGARDAEANQAYGAARRQAGPVDITPAVRAIDDVLEPGVHSIARPNNQIAHDSIEGALARVRSMITDGRSNLTDFNAVFRAKLDLDDMITKAENQGAGNRAHYLANVQNVLDQTLADASAPYAAARDAFAAASRRIEAIGAGKTAAMRGRAQDTTAVYNAMTPEEQAAFRAGYADPLIEQAQSAAVGVDKSRPLISDATGMEFPVVAAPGRSSRLWNQLGREKQMFETRNAAMGGSKSADNLADMADMTQFDPSIMGTLLQGRIWPAAGMAVSKALNETKGLPPSVLSRVAQTLMQTDPQAARAALEGAARRSSATAGRRATANAVIDALAAPAAARLSR
ncbi:MAG: hypothetical protein EOR51_12010 [Mesorhizobium sp.]|uniref:hypothetical protein n=1 Tax=Mesorhizobium sp. TaxID=1871066 RepID=UPI000FE5A381|nr:hypothetical protein [Mesorhizobium sp.]RWK79629.1 MAG: hypothetical protein EOR50_05740 [Mesorhizobium sp.]RWK82404.1 MAG: hypothetical protein EOR51_12010 [Mesorhizobium sp.]RWL08777.1 MAG: hypothetical protein EOR55_03540 [Mesorhizobium sp.]